jgi:hypothetical protein
MLVVLESCPKLTINQLMEAGGTPCQALEWEGQIRHRRRTLDSNFHALREREERLRERKREGGINAYNGTVQQRRH